MGKFHRQPLLERLRKQSVRLLMSADHASMGIKLPSNFIDDLTQCLDAGDPEHIEPCLGLLSRVTFTQPAAKQHEIQDLKVYIFWKRLYVKRVGHSKKNKSFIEANTLKAASVIICSPTTPAIVKRSVKGDILLIVLNRYIKAGLTPPHDFFVSLTRYAKPISDRQAIVLAECLLERTHDETWACLIPVYPQLLKFLLVLNYGGEAFLMRLRLACDKWPLLNDLIYEYAQTIGDENAKNTIFGKIIDCPIE